MIDDLEIFVDKPKTGDKFPVVILLQGFLGKCTGEKLSSLSKYLTDNGFATVRFNYPGFGRSGGDLEKDYLVSNILSALDRIYSYLLTWDFVDISKVVVWGQSLGGMLAILFASKHPEIKAVCAVSPPSQTTRGDDLEKQIPEWKENGFIVRSDDGKAFKLPYSFVTDIQKYDANIAVKSIKAPILIMIGTKDGTVVPKNSKEIFDNANEPKELIELEGMVHDYKVQPEFMEKVNALSGDFLKKSLEPSHKPLALSGHRSLN